jgi:hypothetical protein
MGYKPTDWVNPFEDHGRFGQGFDDVFEHPTRPGEYVIAEYKGGSAELSPGQMDRAWVQGNINRLLRQAPWNPWGPILRDALNQGRLHGVAVSTSAVNGTVGETVIIGQWTY